MTIYVSPFPWTDSAGRQWFHLWADEPNEAILSVYSVGGDITTRHPSPVWEAYSLTGDQFAAAVGQGATVTDFWGPAEHVAEITGDRARLRKIAERRRLT